MRPLDIDNVVGDCTKAKKNLGWKPKVTFEAMAARMVINDIKLLKQKIF
jgi:GDPmannose 4,6-dehydratase